MCERETPWSVCVVLRWVLESSCMSAVSACNAVHSPGLEAGAHYHPRHVPDIHKGIMVPLWNGPMAMLQTTVLQLHVM